MPKTMEYNGTDLLETLQYAVNYNNFIASLILKNVTPDDNILDIGAGTGTFAKLISRSRANIVCFEPDLKQAALLKSMGFETYTSLDEVENDKYDFVYVLNVLEHIENDRDALVEWSAKLKNGGCLFIYVPAFNVLFSAMDKKVCHYRRYTRKTLTQAVIAAGLTPVQDAQYADSIGFFVSLIYKFIGSNTGDFSRWSLVFFDRILFPISKCLDLLTKKWFGKNVFIVVKKC